MLRGYPGSLPNLAMEDDDEQSLPEAPPGGAPSAPAPSQGMPQGVSPSIYQITPEDIARQQGRQNTLAGLGTIVNGLANQQSFGNFFLGRMNPNQDVTGETQQMIQQAGQPVQNKLLLAMNDSNSPQNKAFQNMLKGFAPKGIDLSGVTIGMHGNYFPQLANVAMMGAMKGAMVNAMQERADVMKEGLNQRDTTTAQSQAAHAANQFQPRLEGAARIHDIFEGIKNGSIKGNVAAKSLILSEIQRLETGASNPAFEGQTQKEMSTMAERLGELSQKLSGNPQDTVPPEVMNQLQTLSSDLGKNYMKQADSAYDVMSAGARPGQKSVLNAQRQALHDTYRPRFGFWHGEKTENAPSQSVAPAGGPQPGQIEEHDGKKYKFKGGDPSKQENWETM